MKKALIAMSGGVDSSLAAKLIKDMGYETIGCTMKLYDNADIGEKCDKTCCSLDDVEDARSVARKIDIPYYVFNYKDEFKTNVIDRFIRSYEMGETPNPCIDCNKYLKFEALYQKAKVLGCDYIVTGHYARIEKKGDKYLLKKAKDDTKDQSYVLYNLTQEKLAHTLFPLGNMDKKTVRFTAKGSDFINAEKHDSQDICFVPDGDYAAFIKKNTKKEYKEGDYIDEAGNVLGRHKGIINYTIGQRKGLGIALGHPVFVKSINPLDNTVTLSDNEGLMSTTLIAREFNWISGEVPKNPVRCLVKVRYRQKEQPATVTPIDETSVKIVFDTPQRAISKGQSAVLYDGDIVLGGGIIK